MHTWPYFSLLIFFNLSHLWERLFEGGWDGAVDEEVGGEVEHDEEVSHGLQAHHPQGRDVLVILLHTVHLLLWTGAKKLRKHQFDNVFFSEVWSENLEISFEEKSTEIWLLQICYLLIQLVRTVHTFKRKIFYLLIQLVRTAHTFKMEICYLFIESVLTSHTLKRKRASAPKRILIKTCPSSPLCLFIWLKPYINLLIFHSYITCFDDSVAMNMFTEFLINFLSPDFTIYKDEKQGFINDVPKKEEFYISFSRIVILSK